MSLPWTRVAGRNDDLLRQAEVYRGVVRACLQSPGCTAIQTWGFTDKYSWIGSHSHGTRGAALPFDRNYKPKPAYDAMLEEISKQSESSCGAGASVPGRGLRAASILQDDQLLSRLTRLARLRPRTRRPMQSIMTVAACLQRCLRRASIMTCASGFADYDRRIPVAQSTSIPPAKTSTASRSSFCCRFLYFSCLAFWFRKLPSI